jgi:aspartyl-tRNA(Asn)/glutamyl-tRNA(Gln) amidotransferase subunit B
MRCDVNVSVNRKGEGFGTRCELKNLNRIKVLSMAIGRAKKTIINMIYEADTYLFVRC